MTSIVDKDNVYTNFKHFVVDTRSFQIEKARNVQMYYKLRVYIQKQNEKRQQEMEMSAELKRAKREKELKHKRDKSTLDEIREEITAQEKQLEDLKNEKDRLFAAFKKVLTQDETRKNMQRAREAAFNNITFSTPNSADLPKPYQSAIVTMAANSHAPPTSVISSQSSLMSSMNHGPPTQAPPSSISQAPPTLSINGQQIFLPHLQALSSGKQQPQPAPSPQQQSSLQMRRAPTPQTHLSAPSAGSKGMLQSHHQNQGPQGHPMGAPSPHQLQQLQQQQQQHQQSQPLMLSKMPPVSHHSSVSSHPLHAGFPPGMIAHSQASNMSQAQSFVDRGRVSITGKRTHEQSQNLPTMPNIPGLSLSQLSGQAPPSSLSSSFLPPRGSQPPGSLLAPGVLGHSNGQGFSPAQAFEQYQQLLSLSGMPNNPLAFLTNPNLPK